jgi:hypothetical protein
MCHSQFYVELLVQGFESLRALKLLFYTIVYSSVFFLGLLPAWNSNIISSYRSIHLSTHVLKICREAISCTKDITDNFIALISHGITLLLNGLESATSGFSSSRASANNSLKLLSYDR